MGDVHHRHEQILHARTRDWPGPWPALVDPVDAWHALGCPSVVWVLPTERGFERSWITSTGDMGWDGGHGPMPGEVLDCLRRSGCRDDVVIVGPEEVRGKPLPMYRLPDNEPLNCYGAVTLLPSLSWGIHAEVPTSVRQICAYIDPDVDLHRARSELSGLPVSWANELRELPKQIAAGCDAVLIAAHASRTSDGSVDIRDHTSFALTPEELATWSLPATVLLVGCRTATVNTQAPLHLVEAALIAGAGQIVATTEPTDDEVADRVVRRLLWLMTRGLSASQALQGALQQFERAYPQEGWPFTHTGVPGCAVGAR